MKNCVVVVPLYMAPNPLELKFLENGLEKLENFEFIIACPEGLQIGSDFGKLRALKTKKFAESYFQGIQGYNRLLLSEEFYNAFNAYEYLLIHQADVYIFKNELGYWCNKGFAYIGAPWFRPKDHLLKLIFNHLRKAFSKSYGKKHNIVGNGGFSLRNVQKSLKVLSAAPDDLLQTYRENTHHFYNEDVFWSLEAPKLIPEFNIPGVQTGLKFGIELNPEQAMERLNGALPFGCHAPLVHGKEFWKNYIPELNKSYL